ncbi:Uncharacterised protein [Serratia marcescens]|uniref:hypothetical protein n=1 Tax=Serratia marcescens TaxID=615 RepID=UPI00217B110F|nr:hypothetical protein [Serratia marcescens]CAI1564053.1 Uncharacterised protein [Serratia marcescens]
MERLFHGYQVNYFTSNNDVSATPPILGALLSQLSTMSLLPTFGQELNPMTGEKRKVVIMTDSNETFRIEFVSNTVIFQGGGENAEEFFNKVEMAMGILKNIFPEKKANRLAFLSSTFYRDSAAKYDELYKSLFTHHKANPIEWDNRIVERDFLEDSGEETNFVSVIKRCMIRASFIDGGDQVDVINIEVDTNTIPENDTYRFDFDSALKIMRELLNKNVKLMGSFARYTNS